MRLREKLKFIPRCLDQLNLISYNSDQTTSENSRTSRREIAINGSEYGLLLNSSAKSSYYGVLPSWLSYKTVTACTWISSTKSSWIDHPKSKHWVTVVRIRNLSRQQNWTLSWLKQINKTPEKKFRNLCKQTATFYPNDKQKIFKNTYHVPR
jgi:hypothetical protein